jgi:hypothetical protein
MTGQNMHNIFSKKLMLVQLRNIKTQVKEEEVRRYLLRKSYTK